MPAFSQLPVAPAVSDSDLLAIVHAGVTSRTTRADFLAGITDNILPAQTGQAGRYLSTNGTTASWQPIVIPSVPVTSVFGRVGDILAQAGDYSVSQVTGAAPLASPVFTGNPTAPTPANADNSVSLATTAFVKNQGYLTSVPGGAVTSVFGRAGDILAQAGDYTVSQVTGAAPLASPAFTGFLNVSGTIRTTGLTVPGTGVGIEILWTGAAGIIQVYNRDTNAYQDLHLAGSNIFFDAPVTLNSLSVPNQSIIAGIRFTGNAGINTIWNSVSGVATNITTNGGTISLGAGVSKTHLFIDTTGAVLVSGFDSNVVGLAVRATPSQSGNLQEWQDSSGNPAATVSENGYYTTRKNTAPADAELATSELAFWFDNTAGAARLMVKARDSGGTVRTGSVVLT
jgi:hypothetical protein